MALFALGDTHLSFGSAKPMDVFAGWGAHADKIAKNWIDFVSPADTVVIPGDVSWAMTLPQALPDFQFLHELPGRKIILKGNHDYWWDTRKKIEAFWLANGLDSLFLLHNNSILCDRVALCGSRGWFFDCEAAEDHKVLLREAGRVRASILAGKKLRADALCVFLHYPPISKSKICHEIFDVLVEEGVTHCYYGHLHGQSIRHAFEGEHAGIQFRLVSADALQFAPLALTL